VTETWTRQRVLDLAPDASSAKAGDGLGKASKWSLLGRHESAVWGEIKGSGSKPYQVRIDLSEPAFKCSCPSRKFPCKHALGLMFVLAGEMSAVVEASMPEWVSDWLAKRSERSEQREQRAQERAARPIDVKAQAKRAAMRDERIRAGIEEAAIWLSDVIRTGLATAQTQPGSYWEHAAARLVDAQAPGLARYVRMMRDEVASDEQWQERFLDVAGRLYLAIDAYRRLDALPDDLRADVCSTIGITVNTNDLIATQPAVSGQWLVLGQQVEQEERLQVRRTWLTEANDAARAALILDFAVGAQPLDPGLVVGTSFSGELVYYPSRQPLRAVVKDRGAIAPFNEFPARTLVEALAGYSGALAASPWIERWPMSLRDVSLRAQSAGDTTAWLLCDADGNGLPLSRAFRADWTALSVTGGRPCRVFGEWDGRSLLPLTIQSDQGVFVAGRQTDGPLLGKVSA